MGGERGEGLGGPDLVADPAADAGGVVEDDPVGTPPTYSKICLSAWHTHSAFSEGKTWANPMLENGKESTKKLILRLAPTMAKSASPKSACASPGSTPGRGRIRRRLSSGL